MAVELRPSKRPPSDYYFQNDFLKKRDLFFGCLTAAVFWYFCFYPVWFAAPITIFIVSAILIRRDIKRRYLAYGAILLLFFPLILIGGGGFLHAGFIWK
jgi:hypothetical protein